MTAGAERRPRPILGLEVVVWRVAAREHLERLRGPEDALERGERDEGCAIERGSSSHALPGEHTDDMAAPAAEPYDLAERIGARLPSVRWVVRFVSDRLVDGPADLSQLISAARRRLLYFVTPAASSISCRRSVGRALRIWPILPCSITA